MSEEPETWRDVFSWTPSEVRREAHVYLGLVLMAIGAGLSVFGGLRWSLGFYSGSIAMAWGLGAAVLGGGLFYLGLRGGE
jgi:hypothetical protein